MRLPLGQIIWASGLITLRAAQVGFIKFIVLPTFEALSAVIPKLAMDAGPLLEANLQVSILHPGSTVESAGEAH